MAVAIAVQVRFFARLRELAGVETESFSIAQASTLAGVYDALLRKHSALPERATVRAALNHEFADWDSTVADGDEVAFIPPVSGGL